MTAKRVLVLGAGGMLGSAVVPALAASGFTVTASARRSLPAVAGVGFLASGDLRDADALRRVVDDAAPDVVVNCAGLVKQRADAEDTVAAIETNALLPHRLAALCAARGARLVHVGTDCVFSGAPHGHRGEAGYRECDPPDPQDTYGRSKLLGEVTNDGSVTLRMSLIGREPSGSRLGLVEWFLGVEGSVRGFSRALFTGLTTPVAARLMARLLRDHPDLHGLWHVAAAPISKLDLLVALRDRARPGLPIEASETPVIDRRLDGSAFAGRTGWVAPSWDSMLDEMLKAD